MNAEDYDKVLRKAQELIAEHAARYVASEVQDIYKLLYQAFCGPEHAVASADAASRRFFSEWNRVAAHDGIIYEKIGIVDVLYRINLAPAKQAGCRPQRIFEMFCESAERFQPRHALFARGWKDMKLFIAKQNERYKVSEYEALTKLLEERNFPPVHHSRRYKKHYSPAYRLTDEMQEPSATL